MKVNFSDFNFETIDFGTTSIFREEHIGDVNVMIDVTFELDMHDERVDEYDHDYETVIDDLRFKEVNIKGFTDDNKVVELEYDENELKEAILAA